MNNLITEFIEFLESKINACDAVQGMDREKETLEVVRK
jgi:hypothetical protein